MVTKMGAINLLNRDSSIGGVKAIPLNSFEGRILPTETVKMSHLRGRYFLLQKGNKRKGFMSPKQITDPANFNVFLIESLGTLEDTVGSVGF